MRSSAATHDESRIAQRLHDVHALLARLYGKTSDFERWFKALMVAVNVCAQARPQTMRELDAARLASPDWFTSQQMLAYTAYVDRFGGNLRGITQRIPHLQSLGVTYLHLLPFLKARVADNDGGYAVSSFEEIEPRLGTMEDLTALAAELRKAGISLCSDLVLNHVADDHAWAQKALAGEEKYRDYFVLVDDAQRARYEATLGEVFPATAPGNFTYIDALKRNVWTTFYPYQWDLNYANPAVFAEMAIALLKLANAGVEVFRLDSVAFLWKREGTSCTNLEEAHTIVQALRCIMDIAAPGTLLKAEAIMPTRELPPYLGINKTQHTQTAECHLAYHSSLMSAMWLSLAEQNTQVLKQVIHNTPALPPYTSWLTYVRCHDDIGWNVLRPELNELGDNNMKRASFASRFFSGEVAGSYAKGAKFQAFGPHTVNSTNGMASALCGFQLDAGDSIDVEAERRLLLLYRSAWAFGGMPLIYMGDEIGLANCTTPEPGMSAAEDGRSLHRPALNEAHFARRLQAGTREQRLYAQFCALARVRASLPQLAANVSRTLIELNDKHACIALQRSDSFLFIANFTSTEQALSLQVKTVADQTWRDAETGEAVTPSACTLLPWHSRWLVTSSPA